MAKEIVDNRATERLSEVEALVFQLAAAEQQLESGYSHLGVLLEDIDKNEYWRTRHESMGSFMIYLSEKYHVGRAQLYNYRATAVALLGAGVTEKEMNTMGINKAKELARSAKTHNGTLPDEAIQTALQPKTTVKDVRRILGKALNLPPDENTDWFDLGFQFYVTAEERATLQDAISAAKHGDPPISSSLEPSAQLKQVALKWAQEFLGSHSENVVDTVAEVW